MSGFQFLFILFLLVPLVEIYFLVQVGQWIGAGWTVFLVVFTAVLGAALVRSQGLATIQKVQRTMARGEMPAIEMLEGMLIFVAGALLLTPGFFTDTVGFLCLVPPLRQAVVLRFLRRGVMGAGEEQPGTVHKTRSGKRIIDGDYRRMDD
jgi:UPF0716 protein FxsA